MNTSKSIKASLEQLAIFAWFATGIVAGIFSRCIVVRAYAGTGKTWTIAQGITHVPQSVKTILYAVFGKRNEVEAQDKIYDSRVTIKTLHALGFHYIRKQWGFIQAKGYVEKYRCETVCPGIPWQVTGQLVKLVDFLKNSFIGIPSLEDIQKVMDNRGIECLGAEFKPWNSRLPELAVKVLELSKEKSKLISFGDMVWLPVTLGIVTPDFDLVCIDECQDMSLPQLTMGIQACKPNGRLCLVGDDKQGMFGFRGSISNAITMFKQKLNAAELTLSATFRCPKIVVKEAQAYVPEYMAHETNNEGELVRWNEEKAWGEVKVNDAVLSRKNAPLMRVCLALLRKGTPARIEGKDIGKGLLDIVASLEANTVPEFMDKLSTWQTLALSKATGQNAGQKQDRIADEYETLKTLAETCNTVDAISDKIKGLFVDSHSEYGPRPKPAVVCSSVHKAKGLEWDNVYMLMESFKVRATQSDEEAQEERNIRYVAITRAKARLCYVVG